MRAFLFLFGFVFSGSVAARPLDPLFSSPDAGEYEVSFDAVYEATDLSAAELRGLSQADRDGYAQSQIIPVMDYLFGPLTRRALGSPKRSRDVTPDWNALYQDGSRVFIPYHYRGTWIVDQQYAQGFTIPVPLNTETVFTASWLSCTDYAPEHRTRSFYWYFWDPARPGCDQRENVNYKQIRIQVGRRTLNQTRSFPEYARMMGKGHFSMTLAFGYVTDNGQPNPETDSDFGVGEYRDFLNEFRSNWGRALSETQIYQREYPSSSRQDLVIGRRFTGAFNGTQVTVNILVNAGIDQMELFAKSFAHDHDDVFGWFGHSRVGSGFDARRFGNMVAQNPRYYSISEDYQMIYWAGCNSYSYYTTPFFKFKADASAGRDPQGTKNLDIIANGLPSLFALNARNAGILTEHMLNWNAHASYQKILADIKSAADDYGQKVLVAVIGDEDNAEGPR